MKRFRINPQKKELKEKYEKVLNEWYEHHRNTQNIIADICRSGSKELDMAQKLCKILKQEVYEERIANEELDRLTKQLRSTRWIIFE
jgi:hypothetical protein